MLQLMIATLMPLTAHGASVLPSSQLAEPLLRPRVSQLPSSNAATFLTRSKMKRSRMMKSQPSWVCSAEDTMDKEVARDKADTKNGNTREVEEDNTTEEKMAITDLHTMVEVTKLVVQSSLLSS
jgi:hypothetical protein